MPSRAIAGDPLHIRRELLWGLDAPCTTGWQKGAWQRSGGRTQMTRDKRAPRVLPRPQPPPPRQDAARATDGGPGGWSHRAGRDAGVPRDLATFGLSRAHHVGDTSHESSPRQRLVDA
jgi:hypothetical protein